MEGRTLTASWADGRVHIIIEECISSVTCKFIARSFAFHLQRGTVRAPVRFRFSMRCDLEEPWCSCVASSFEEGGISVADPAIHQRQRQC